MDSLLQSFATLPAFLLYFGLALGLLALFLTLYVHATPYAEFKLIREGNTAAAISLSGTLLGFVLPLASAIAHSVSAVDCALWGLVALIVQIIVYLGVRMLVPGIAEAIPSGKTAPATLLASMSVGIGILNAACMTY